ncbi:hypothetical protein HDU92_003762 [Lobulomyces angularis]|nr:hypothetical protein HDU92_003762 [Lobulomyces angularis]
MNSSVLIQSSSNPTSDNFFYFNDSLLSSANSCKQARLLPIPRLLSPPPSPVQKINKVSSTNSQDDDYLSLPIPPTISSTSTTALISFEARLFAVQSCLNINILSASSTETLSSSTEENPLPSPIPSSQKKSKSCFFPCTFEGCQKVFARKHNLKSHYIIHTEKKKFECDKCQQRFLRKYDRKRHQLTVHKVSCTSCHKSFESIEKLNDHLPNCTKKSNFH